jgi:hypothetical protein
MTKMNKIKLYEDYNHELNLGKKIEKEHDSTYNKIKEFYEKNGDFPTKLKVFQWIAEDHLKEFKDYYTRLEEMEKLAKKSK